MLIGIGGVVTSHEAGMSVPDWPTSYGYNMFLFPVRYWHGGIFYEHTHRLFASLVGLLTVVLAVWLWIREPRSWLRWLGVGAVGAVMAQGVLGGLRVIWLKDDIGIIHATLAQCFFVLVTSIALFTSGHGVKLGRSMQIRCSLSRLRWLAVGGTFLILMQLILGATMRHQHAGLAIPDFPLAYGKLWPPTDAPFLERVNSRRMDVEQFKPITSSQIILQMAHRLVALSILLVVGGVAWKARRNLGASSLTAKLALAWSGIVCLQAAMGAATVWSNKAADVATAHVLLGSLSLSAGAVLCAGLVASPQNCSGVKDNPENATFGNQNPHNQRLDKPQQEHLADHDCATTGRT